ncbi:NUDIX domain-containing protein [Nocardioides marmoribigeumensis]
MTVDVVALSVRPDDGLCALAVRRGSEPHKGRWALPGGFVDKDEPLDKAAARELGEETGVSPRSLELHQVGAYGAPKRDPRGRVVSLAWLTALPASTEVAGGDDATDARWFPVADLLKPRKLAFDHATILKDALALAGRELEDSSFGTRFLPRAFTVSDLREVYEAVWEQELDAGNFQRKVTGVPGLLKPTGRTVQRGRGRPAALYTAGSATTISPPLTRVG